MGWLSKVLGKSAAAPIKEIGSIIDDIHTSGEEKADANQKLVEVGARLQTLQAEITKQEAQHRTIFVAGWRPGVGWICVIGLAMNFVIAPLLAPIYEIAPPDPQTLLSLVLALTGVGSLRTIEKAWGLTR